MLCCKHRGLAADKHTYQTINTLISCSLSLPLTLLSNYQLTWFQSVPLLTRLKSLFFFSFCLLSSLPGESLAARPHRFFGSSSERLSVEALELIPFVQLFVEFKLFFCYSKKRKENERWVGSFICFLSGTWSVLQVLREKPACVQVFYQRHRKESEI